MLGREVDLLLDLLYGFTQEEATEALGYSPKLRQKMEQAHDIPRKHKKSAVYQRCNYDHKAHNAGYSRGNVVMARVHSRKMGVSPKLQPKWDGPYIVTKVWW